MRLRQTATDLLFTVTVAGWLPVSGSAWAAIDAGAQIRCYQDETQRRLTPGPRNEALPETLPPSPGERARRASDERIHVAAFAVVGVTRFPPEEVAAVLQPFVGQTLDTAGIHAAVGRFIAPLHRHWPGPRS